MLMVVFGAGASFDSAPSRKPIARTIRGYRPPLADNLFDGREEFRTALNTYWQIQPIVPYLRDRGTRSLEEVLQELYENTENHPQRSRQMMALRFYIRDVIDKCSMGWLKDVDGVTNQKTLVDQILEWPSERTLFVTFNYDELIEDALLGLGFRAQCFEDYITRLSQFALYKLHGSIRWARLVKPSAPISQSELIDEAMNHNPHEKTGFRIYDNPAATTIDDWLAIPAITVPVYKKSSFECPVDHLNNLVDYLPRVDKILAIGWRAKEAHFMSLLTQHLRHLRAIWVVSNDDANTILRDLTEQLSLLSLRPMTFRPRLLNMVLQAL
jgi:SIR2-like domain